MNVHDIEEPAVCCLLGSESLWATSAPAYRALMGCQLLITITLQEQYDKIKPII